MAQAPRTSCQYAIDERDNVVSFSDAWVAFAQQNEAPELTRSAVLGRPIWQFISGEETRNIYEHLFSWVRQNDACVNVPFRCDSPRELRFMRLNLAPFGSGGIDLHAVLERVVPRSPVRILERMALRADYGFQICSFCKRIFAFGAWLELQDAISRLRWLESENPPKLTEDVCEACAQACRSAINAS